MKTITKLGDQTNKVTDTSTIFKFCLWDNGVPQDVTGKTVTATIANSTSYLFDEPLIKNGTEVDLDFSSDSMKQLVPDTYSFEISVTNADGDVEVYPTEGNLQFTVVKNLRGTQGNLVPQVTFDSVLKSVDDKIAKYKTTIAKGDKGDSGDKGDKGKDGYSSDKYVNVSFFGVTGKAEDDNTKEILTGISQTASDNKILWFPAGTYNLSQTIMAVNNIHIVADPDALFIKKHDSYTFKAHDGKGYGSGGKNIVIDGGRWYGSDDFSMTQSFSLLHISDSTFKNMVFERAINAGHAFDIMGGQNLVFYNNTFIGIKTSSDRYFTEAIQLDEATKVGASSAYDDDSYDGLPTKDISVIKNKTLPVLNDKGQIVYYAPSLVGNHYQVENYHVENIVIEENKLIDVNPFMEKDNQLTGGSIHLRNVNNVKIINNHFRQSQASVWGGIAINIIIGELYMPLNDVALSSPQTSNGATDDVFSIEIKGNTFEGIFANEKTTNNGWGIIRINGSGKYNIPIRNVSINNNKFLNCINPAHRDDDVDVGITALSVNSVDVINIDSNNFYDVVGILDIGSVTGVTFNNNSGEHINKHIIKSNNVSGTMTNNAIDKTHGAITSTGTGTLVLSNNAITNFSQTSPSINNYILSIGDEANYIINGNVLDVAAGEQLETALLVSETTKHVIISNNQYHGTNTWSKNVIGNGNIDLSI